MAKKRRLMAAQTGGSRIAVERQTPAAALRMLKQPLYDTVECPADANAVASLILFNQPLGSALNVSGAIKNRADTNLSKSAALGTPNEFLLYGVNMCFTYDTGYLCDAAPTLANFLNDMVEVYDQGVFRLRFGQNKDSLVLPLIAVPHGDFFLTGESATASDNAAAAGNSFVNISNGESSKREFFKHFSNKQPIFIDSEETFTVRLEWPNAAMGLSANGDESRMTVYLVGVYSTGL